MGKSWVGHLGNPNAEASGPPPRSDPEKELRAWEESAAWSAKRWKLDREANALLLSSGVTISRKGDVSVPEGVIHPKPPKVGLSDEEFDVVLAAVVMMILS